MNLKDLSQLPVPPKPAKPIDFSKVKIGFELECLIPSPSKKYFTIRDRANFARLCEMSKYGSYVSDGSVHPSHGSPFEHFINFEFVSSVFKLYEINRCLPLLSAMRKNGAVTNQTCGMHFHVSLNQALHLETKKHYDLLEEFVKILRNRLYNFKAFDYREEYCKLNFPSSKYTPCRMVDAYDSHFEIRIFNGSLNPRAFQNNVKQIKKIISWAFEEVQK